jgi:signal transduction histidine kinase
VPDKEKEKINILVVDDVPQNLVAIRALLDQPDLNIITASSGHQALEALLVNEVALALIDVQMPVMDGFELAELIRGSERTRSVPLIFLTAGARESKNWFRGYEAGAVDFLYKPIDDTVLRSKVKVFVELHAKERLLAQQLEELKAALALNELFVAVLGHDLRNPLAAVLNGAELVSRASADALVQSAAGRIKSSGSRMAEMIDQLLDVARIRAGAVEIRRRKMDFEALCHTIVDELSGHEGHARIRIERRGSAIGEGDPDRLAQVMSNLLGNALQHSAGDSQILVELDGTMGDRISIRISNAGLIPAAELDGIFRPFHSRQTLSRPSSGLGLGLYIVKMFVEKHGGTVSVRSSQHSGTTFEIVLPRPVLPQPSLSPA